MVARMQVLRRIAAAGLAALFVTGCFPMPDPVPPTAPPPLPTPAPEPSAAAEDSILALPAAFRYEVIVGAANAPGESPSVTSGAYRDGAWQQTTTHGAEAPEDLVVARDPSTGQLHSYSRDPRGGGWVRWPGAGFEPGYGLASPFGVLRLYALADETARGETASGFPEPATKVQAAFTPETVGRLLVASAAAVAIGEEMRAALIEQMSSLLAPQTITYWVTEAGRVYQAAATLLVVGEDGAPEPWLEVSWQFSSYDDPAIAISAPATFSAVTDLAGVSSAAGEGARDPELEPGATLRVRVFENTGVLAQNATVTVFPVGEKQALDEKASADAQFALPPGAYDVLVRAANAEQRLEGVVTPEEGLASRDVLFDFGTLEVSVFQSGQMPEVDIVVYPAGQREVWADYRSENPATIRVPAGVYDIEVGLPDLSGVRAVNGVAVAGGETISQTVNLDE